MSAIKEIIEVAIQREEDYYNFFFAYAKQLEDDEYKKLFYELAQEELEHKESLKAVIYEQIDKYDMTRLSELQTAGFLTPLKISCELSVKEIWKAIIDKKKETYAFYKLVAQMAPTQKLKSFYQNLANIELALNKRLEGLRTEDMC